MPRFQYNARNSRGDLVKGNVDARDYTTAIKRVASSNLFIIELVELKQDVQYDEPKLEPKNDIKRPEHSDAIIFTSVKSTAPEHPQSKSETKTPQHKPNDELKELCEQVESFLQEKGEHMTQATRENLILQLEKVSWVRESQNDQLLQKQLKTIEKLLKKSKKEVNHYEIKMWEQWGKGLKTSKGPSKFKLSTLLGIESESLVEEHTAVHQKAVFVEGHPTNPIQQVLYWYQVLSHPDDTKEEELLMREKYDAVWTEMQRFIGVLLFCYMIFYFVAYTYLQTRVDDSFLLRVYDTPLFKQIVVALFLGFGLLTLRKNFIARKMWVDGVMFVSWVAVLWTLMR
jgi:hypothetical protein